MRILFVDDEPRVLEGIERSLFHLADEWEITCVESGGAALGELESTKYDVVVSDMRMPEMDGAALLSEIHQRHPSVVRIILSGQASLDATYRAVPVAHQYLSKPCEAETLQEVVERTYQLQKILNDDAVRQAVGQVRNLPSVPRIYGELMQAMEDASAGADEVAEIVQKDMAMSAKILQMANSSFFGRATAITEVREAVVRLGFQIVKDLVLLVEVFSASNESDIEGFSIEDEQRHALRCAAVARQITSGKKQREDAFTAAIVHDIGKLVIAAELPKQLQAALKLAGSEKIPLHEAERRVLNTSHAEIGAYLLGLWRLPPRMVEAVANHHQPRRVPQQTEFGLLGAVYVADCLVDETEIDEEYLAEVGALDRLEDWREIAKETN